MIVCIYSLIDPRNGLVRYIGKAHDVRRRFNTHVRQARAGSKLHCKMWIASLLREGLEPEVSILERCQTRKKADERERFWIAYHRWAGSDLTNTTNGGDGQSPGYQWSVEARAKLSASNKGRKCSPEHVAKMKAAFNTDEAREVRRRGLLRGLKANPEWARKVAAGTMSGRKMSAEAKARISAKWTVERKVAHAKQQREKQFTPEWRAQLAAALKARWDKYRESKDAHYSSFALE